MPSPVSQRYGGCILSSRGFTLNYPRLQMLTNGAALAHRAACNQLFHVILQHTVTFKRWNLRGGLIICIRAKPKTPSIIRRDASWKAAKFLAGCTAGASSAPLVAAAVNVDVNIGLPGFSRGAATDTIRPRCITPAPRIRPLLSRYRDHWDRRWDRNYRHDDRRRW
jgi:hypothetical protein